MDASDSRTVKLTTEQDVVSARQAVRQLCQELGFSLVEQTKTVTAASELARNTVTHEITKVELARDVARALGRSK